MKDVEYMRLTWLAARGIILLCWVMYWNHRLYERNCICRR